MKRLNDQESQELVLGQCKFHFPADWPTHRGSKDLWEELGRTVGAFSLLERALSPAMRSLTGHSTIQATLKDPGCVRNPELAGLLTEIEALRRPRDRLRHGAWIAFETSELARVRFFPRGEEMDGKHQQMTSLDDLTCIKTRVMDVYEKLGARVPTTPVHEPPVCQDRLWEEIGRTVATFGMLEDLLPRALYVITGHASVDETKNANQQVESWCAGLIKNMSDTLCGLAHSLEAAWTERDGLLHQENANLVQEIQILAGFRNRVCHATYQDFVAPDVLHTRDGPSDSVIVNETVEAGTIGELQDARLRVVATIAALRIEVRTKCRSGFPGANDL